MAGHGLSVEQMAELVALARGWGEIAAGEAYGEEGPDFDVDLSGIEEVGWQMSRALNQGLCEALTARQAERLPEVRPCPGCGAECEVERTGDDGTASRRRPRTMHVRGGPFELREPRCFCDRCGRSFFPSADGAADQREGVQPGGAGQAPRDRR
jgi:hypothetical protein